MPYVVAYVSIVAVLTYSITGILKHCFCKSRNSKPKGKKPKRQEPKRVNPWQ